jgi:hypothetical protein
VRLLVEDVADGIRVLQTRDGVKVTEEQILDRARNIVAGLIGNYAIKTLDAQERAADRAAASGPSRPAVQRGARTVDQLNLLDRVESRAEARLGRPVRA